MATDEQNNQTETNAENSQADNLVNETQKHDESAVENKDTEKTANHEDNQEDLNQKYNELNDKYLRLYSEFDNYRKRSLKERAEYLKTANEDVLKAILPVIDDFERAIKANEQVEDIKAIKDGVQLIYNKLLNTVKQKGLEPFTSKGEAFDADLMEAITHIPAPNEQEKGKVIDEVEKGYKLGDKVIRFAKVVVGS